MKRRSVVKLNANQLRKIIKEAISTSAQIEEAGDDHAKGMSDLFYEHMMSMYDSGDPSMNAVGREAWEQQVAKATDEFEFRVTELLEELENKLIQGEYHRG